MTLRLGALVATWMVVGGGAMAQRVGPPMDPRDAARQVHKQNDYPDSVRTADGQGSLRRFPAQLGDADEDERRRLQRSGRTDLDDHDAADGRNPAEPEGEGSGWSLPSLSGLSGVGRVLAWGLLIAGGLALLGLLGYLLFSSWPGRDRSAPAAPMEPGVIPTTAEGLPFEAGDPDALAAEDRFAEAILALLVQSLRAVGWRPATEGSLTAREVLWSVLHGDPRRPPLRAVVEGAERVRFGTEPATRELFEVLRAERDVLLAKVAEAGPMEDAA